MKTFKHESKQAEVSREDLILNEVHVRHSFRMNCELILGVKTCEKRS